MICSRDPGMILFVGIGKKPSLVAVDESIHHTREDHDGTHETDEADGTDETGHALVARRPGPTRHVGLRTTSVTPTSQVATDWPSRGAERRRSTTRASTRSEACSNNRGAKGADLTFSSQNGEVPLSRLKLVNS